MDKPPDYILRVVVILIAAAMGAPMILSVGRGIGCAVRGGCPFDEIQYLMEQFGNHLATLIALLLALLSRPKDGPQ